MSKVNTSIQRFVIALVLVAISFVSMACECGVTDVATHWHSADVVFKGKVVSVDMTTGGLPIHKRVTLQVSKVYKGMDTESVLTILTPAYGQSCGVIFEIGKEYLVFGSKKSSLTIAVDKDSVATYNTDQCSGTEYWSENYERQLFGLK